MKSKLKRFISVLLAVFTVAGIFTVSAPTFAAEEAAEKDSFSLHKKLLHDIGILSYDIEERSTPLSRGQFMDMAMRLYHKELPSYEKAVTFNDVIPNYEFKDAVEAAYSAGIIKGVSENVFGVDLKIAPRDAVTVLLRILNYEKYIQGYGSYEDNFIRIAAEIDLIDNIDLTKEELSFEDAVQLIYNSTDIVPLELAEKTAGSIIYEAKDNNPLIYERLGIVQREGILTANGYTDLDGGEALSKGRVKVNGITYSSGSSGAEDFLGYNVHIYYDEETDTILHIYDDDTELTVVEVPGECTYSGGVLTYWNGDANKRERIDVGKEAIIVYNDKLVRNGEFSEDLFDLNIGEITIIEESIDGHTVVIIRDYTDIVFDRCIEEDDELIIINKFDSQNNIVISDNTRFNIKNEKGEKIEASGLKDGDVISAAVSMDGTAGRLIVNTESNKLTQAYVLSAEENRALIKTYVEEKHTYEENYFEYTKYFADKNKAEQIVKAGSEYTVYINTFGFVAYMSDDEDMSDFYAYIIKAFAYDSEPDEKGVIRVFRDDGKVGEYRFADNLKIDGISCKRMTNDEIIALLGVNNPNRSGLIYMSLTYDGEVKEIDTCLEETTEREADYSLYKSEREAEDTLYKIDGGEAVYASSIPNRRRYYIETKSFDTGMFITNNTKIFAIPRDSDAPDRFKIITSSSLLNDRCYNVKAYGRDDDSVAADVLLYFYYSRYSDDISTAEVTGSSSYANLPFERTYDTEAGIITKCKQEVNAETGDVEYAVEITNLRSSSKTVYYTEDEELIAGIEEGQLVRYFAVGGDLCYLEKLYSIPDKTFNTTARPIKWVNGAVSVPSYFITHDGNYLVDSYSASSTENPVFGVGRGVIVNNASTHIAYITYDNYLNGNTGENYRKYYTCSSVKVYKYNERGDELEVKSFDDIIAYNESSLLNTEVIVVTKNRAVIGIIMY